MVLFLISVSLVHNWCVLMETILRKTLGKQMVISTTRLYWHMTPYDSHVINKNACLDWLITYFALFLIATIWFSMNALYISVHTKFEREESWTVTNTPQKLNFHVFYSNISIRLSYDIVYIYINYSRVDFFILF